MTYFVTYQRFLLVDLEFPHRVYDVTAADDCISLKDAPGAPSADLHNYPFGDTSATEIPCGCPAEVMEDQSDVSGSLP